MSAAPANCDPVLEVGCGDGELLAAMARRHPDTPFIGLDRTPKRLAAARRATASLPNAQLVHANAEHLARLFPPATFAHILVFHPEPCDRPQDAPNRLLTPAFLAQAADLLRPGGRLHLQTDHPGYYAHLLHLWGRPEPEHFTLARQWLAEGRWGRHPFSGPRVRARDLWPAPPPNDHGVAETTLSLCHTGTTPRPDTPFAGLMTAFERRYRARGLPIYRLEAVKP